MSHYNQNRNFQNSHYQNQSKANSSGEHPRTADLSKIAANLPSLRSKCEALLQKELSALEAKMQNSNTTKNYSASTTTSSDAKALMMGSAKTIAQKNSINQIKANLMKALPYRGGIESETLTKEARDAQTQDDAEKKKRDILRNATANGNHINNNNMTDDRNSNLHHQNSNKLTSSTSSSIAERIDAEGKDSSEKKSLSRLLPRAVVREEQMQMVAQQLHLQKESGQIRQRENDDEGVEKNDKPEPPSAASNSSAAAPPPPSLTVKGGGAVAVGGKKLAVDSRMAFLTGKKKK